MRQAMFSDDVAAKPGPAPGDRPAGEAGHAASSLLVAAALVRHVPVLVGDVPRDAGARGRRRASPLRFFVKRVWLFVPLFTGIVVAPGDARTSSRTARSSCRSAPGSAIPVGLTRQGLDAAALIVTRVAVSISLVVLLTLTTPWNRLLASLRALFVPRMFVLVLGMTYRYVFHLLNGVTDMYTARKARTVTRDTDVDEGARVRRRDRRRAVRQGARALRGGAPGDGVARLHGQQLARSSARRVRAVDGVWASCASASWCIAMLGGDRVLGR